MSAILCTAAAVTVMPNEVEAYRVGPKAFEFKGTNGFMLTIDIKSSDMAPQTSM